MPDEIVNTFGVLQMTSPLQPLPGAACIVGMPAIVGHSNDFVLDDLYNSNFEWVDVNGRCS